MKGLLTCMKNKNALISMACFSESANNPYAVFCEYIKYSVYTHASKKLTISEIQKVVGEEFGIYLPYHILSNCLKILEKEKSIQITDHCVTRIGQYDSSVFERSRNDYRNIESSLIEKLRSFASSYNKNWNDEEARELLTKVLDNQGLAYDIFFHDNDKALNTLNDIIVDDDTLEEEMESGESDGPLYRDEYLVGKFIKEIISTDNIYKDYLISICTGLMICSGVYQLPSSKASIVQAQIRGSFFFFDTKLLLRFIECSGEAAISATKELVKLIQDAGGVVCYYQHTKEEIEYAFDETIRKLRLNLPVLDNEMRLFISKTKNPLAILRAKRSSFVQELSAADIFEKPTNDYTEQEMLKYGFDLSTLRQYMHQNLLWKEKTIDNDALSIWETHMRRRANYDDYCGTSKRLDVFVTSNTRLISIALEFKSEKPHMDHIQSWKSNRLPIITDFRLMCRLWSPASEAGRVPLMYISENAMAALRPTTTYLNRIRTLAIELEKTTPSYEKISLPSFFDDNVSDAILETTKGNADALDISTFATTINELIELKAKEQEEQTLQARDERDRAQEELLNHKNIIVSDAIARFTDKLGWRYLVLWFAKNWSFVFAFVFDVVFLILSIVTGTSDFLYAFIPSLVIIILQKCVSSNCIQKLILKYILPKIEASFTKHISAQLHKIELPYQNEIIEQSISNTKMIKECRELTKEHVNPSSH